MNFYNLLKQNVDRVGRNTNSKVLRSVSLTVAPPIQHHTVTTIFSFGKKDFKDFFQLFSTITEKNEDGLYKEIRIIFN